jgi:hypothetical protein
VGVGAGRATFTGSGAMDLEGHRMQMKMPMVHARDEDGHRAGPRRHDDVHADADVQGEPAVDMTDEAAEGLQTW